MSAQLRQPAPADVESRVFVFCGEGAHSADTDLDMLKFSPSWPAVQQALRDVGHADPEVFLQAGGRGKETPKMLGMLVPQMSGK